jgi:hypothetical protein
MLQYVKKILVSPVSYYLLRHRIGSWMGYHHALLSLEVSHRVLDGISSCCLSRRRGEVHARKGHVGFFSFMRNNKCARLINVSLWGLNRSDGESCWEVD